MMNTIARVATATALVLSIAVPALAAQSTTSKGVVYRIDIEDGATDDSPRVRVRLRSSSTSNADFTMCNATSGSTPTQAYIDLDNDAARMTYNMLLSAHLSQHPVTLVVTVGNNSCRIDDVRMSVR